MSPLTPLLILLLGAAGVLFGLLPRFRYTGLVAVAAAVGALAALLLLALQLPSHATLSAWAPISLFAVGLELSADPLGWLFALALLVVALSALMTGLARPGGSRVGTRATMLLVTVASLLSIFSANLLTRILAWAFLDLIYFAALVFLSDEEGVEQQAVLNLAFNSVGTLLAVAAAVMISRTSDSLSLRDAVLTSQSTLLITLSVVFRLGLFPLHLGLPTAINIRQGLGSLLRLAPALVALETISRLSAFGFPAAVTPWLTVFACAAALVGALQLWSVPDPRQGIAYLVICQSGVALLAGLWGGDHASLSLTMVALSLALGAALIYLGNGYDESQRWPTLLPLVGVAAMAGVPLTLGFLGVGQLFSSLVVAGGWAWLVLLVLVAAQTILVAGLIYTVLWPGIPLESQPLLAAVFYTGLSLPAVMLILIAFFTGIITSALASPNLGLLGFTGAGSLVGLGAVLLSVAGGIALWRLDAPLRDRLGGVGGASLAALARLDWLYRWVWSAFRMIGAAVENLAGVLEGEGAILWTLVAGIVVWLLWKG